MLNAEIIAVGTELTTGDITDTNGAYLSKELSELGINVVGQTVVPDNAKRIVSALSTAVSRSQLIIFTGGLGPTPDDMTKEVLCNAVGKPLTENRESLERIEAYFRKKGMEMAQANRKQALFPEGAIILPNEVGTADGCVIESGNQSIIMLPGPPMEMKRMYNNGVLPYITKKLDGVVMTKTLKIFGMGESTIADRLGDILKSSDPTVATYVGKGDIRIKITAVGGSKAECIAKYEPIVESIKDILGNVIYSEDDKTIAETVVEKLAQQGKMISAAESCTGGLVSKMLTDIKGVSKVYEYGVSAYANRVKTEVLGVAEDLINQKGAVSVEVAEAMAQGVQRVSGAQIGLATTGYASEGEGVPADKIGLVYISLCDGKRVFTRKIMAGHGEKDRERIRLAAAMNCFDMARLYLDEDKGFLASGRALEVIEKPLIKEETFEEEIVQEKIPEQDGVKDVIPEQDIEADEGIDLNAMILSEETDQIEQTVSEQTEENVKEEPKDEENKKKVGFVKSVLPWKGDTKANIIRKIAALLCFAIFLGSGSYIANYYYKGYKNKQLQKELESVFYESTAEGTDGMAGRFTELYKINPEVVGWLKIPGTKTDNPVVKSQSDTATTYKYLYKDFYGKYSSYGTLFTKYNNKFDGDLSQNTAIFGHHMKDGQMFGDLKNYRKLEFYKNNPVIDFTPIYSDKVVKWKVFSVMLVDTEGTPGHGELYDYSKVNFESDDEFLAFVDEAYQRSIIDTPVQDITPEDKIITLSTCAYDFDEARLVVMARMVRDDERPTVETDKAIYNRDAVYPKVHKGSNTGNTTVIPYVASSNTQSASSASSRPTASAPQSNRDDDDDDYDYDYDSPTYNESSSGTATTTDAR